MIRFRLAFAFLTACLSPNRLAGLPPGRVLRLCSGLTLGLLFGSAALVQAAPKPVIALVDATVVAIDGGAPRQNAVVLIEGDRISQVGAAGTVTVPPNAKV